MAITAVLHQSWTYYAGSEEFTRSFHGDNCCGCIKGACVAVSRLPFLSVSMAITAVAASKDEFEKDGFHGDNCRGRIKAKISRSSITPPDRVSMAMTAVVASKMITCPGLALVELGVSMAMIAVAASRVHTITSGLARLSVSMAITAVAASKAEDDQFVIDLDGRAFPWRQLPWLHQR